MRVPSGDQLGWKSTLGGIKVTGASARVVGRQPGSDKRTRRDATAVVRAAVEECRSMASRFSVCGRVIREYKNGNSSCEGREGYRTIPASALVIQTRRHVN